MKKLALLAAARPKYEKRIEDLIEGFGHCQSGWSYKINASKLKILQEQIDKNGFFHIYYHDMEHPEHEEIFGTGTGYVEYKLRIKECKYNDTPWWSPEPRCTPITDKEKPHRLYAKVKDKPIKIPRQKWNTFIDYDSGRYLSGFFPWKFRNKPFGYIIDPEV